MIINDDSVLSGGIGDCIALAWLSQCSKGTDDPLVHFTKDVKKKSLLEMMDQPQTDKWKDAIDLKDSFVDFIADAGAKPHWYYWCKLLGRTDLMPRRPKIVAWIPDLEWVDANIKGLAKKKMVLLFPKASNMTKSWPLPYWMDLAGHLQAAGHLVLTLGDDRDFESLFRMTIRNCPMDRITALMFKSALVVTNDSFPLHLGATVGCPTLGVFGSARREAIVDYASSNVQIAQVTKDRVPCVGCCGAEKLVRPSCQLGCHALMALSPAGVFAKCQEMLDGKIIP